MHGWLRNLLFASALLLVTPFAIGCEAPGVGDPCDPESIPVGGFVPSEAYLETSSVQCRTRVCIVYQLPGYPSRDGECDPATLPEGSTCATATETEDRVYCTCRCDAPTSDATTCECPDGFSCVDVLDSEFAGDGIRGSYCVKSGTVEDEES